MNFQSTFSIIVLALLFIACGDDDDDTIGGGPVVPETEIMAQYRVKLTTTFTEDNFPTDYPEDATFGTIMVITHAPDIDIFEINEFANEGVKSYIENNDVNAIGSFLSNQLGEEREADFVVTSEDFIEGDDSKVINVSVTPTRTRFTILAKLNPSPDWFIGLSSFDIVADDGISLITSETIEFFAMDAGLFDGATYTETGEITNEVITTRKSSPFSEGLFAPTIGKFEINRETMD